MPTTTKRGNFTESDTGRHALASLTTIEGDIRFQTDSSYSANGDKYPDKLIPFVDKHMKYLSEHQSVNLEHYLANLRLMTRIR